MTDEIILEEIGKAWAVVAKGMDDESDDVIEGCIPTVEQVRRYLSSTSPELGERERIQVAIALAMFPMHPDVDVEVFPSQKPPIQ